MKVQCVSGAFKPHASEDDRRLNLFAVGDDDQNIYAWKGASVRFIRRFAQEYKAKEEYLVENYRSTRFIVDAANRCIEGAADRLKRDHGLRVDVRREADPPGGAWAARDKVAQGKVQILHVRGGQLSQAVAAVEELRRLSELDPDWQWNRCAVIARNWADLDPARSACMAHGIPVQSAREELSSFWRARETQQFLRILESGTPSTIETRAIRQYREDVGGDPWADLLAQALDELILDEGHAETLPVAFVRNWLGEWSREIRRRQQGLLLTSAHRAKGLEFDHVVILDGRWKAASDAEDPDAARRLYYVSMTRARETLALVRLGDAGQPDVRDRPLQARRKERAASLLQPLLNTPCVLERESPGPDISDPRLDVRIAECTLKDVVLSFAGWRTAHSDCHRSIGALSPGDPLVVSHADGQWRILEQQGCQVGRMAKGWAPPHGMVISRARVQGIFTRRADDDENEGRRRTLRSSTWEIVVPQLFLSREPSSDMDKPGDRSAG